VVPVGVGSLASAAARHLRTGGRSTTLVSVEPTSAACVLASVAAGAPVEVPGPHRSSMAGLNCGTPSPLAWPRVAGGLDWLVAVDDDQARDAMRALAASGIESGESGAATLAGAAQLRADTGDEVLGPGTTLLLLSTEGATDPVAYREVVGAGPGARPTGR